MDTCDATTGIDGLKNRSWSTTTRVYIALLIVLPHPFLACTVQLLIIRHLLTYDCAEMEILLTSAEISDRIRYVMDAPRGQRYVIVGFIGSSPLQWIPRPKGVHVFCWPLAGGTNPDGIDTLIEAKARVCFVEKLHAKVYHSKRGTVVGSANLSSNALGGVLTETAVWLPPTTFPIEQQLALIERGALELGTNEFAARLAQLREEHNAFRQRNPGERHDDVGAVVESEPGRIRTFGEWFKSAHRPAWQLSAWMLNRAIPGDVEHQYREATGRNAKTWISDERADKYALHLPTLECRYLSNEYGIRKTGIRWWYPDTMYKSAHPDWKETPHIYLAKVMVPSGCSIPFDAREPRFHAALSAAVNKLGKECEAMVGPVTKRFVDTIALNYF
jgi:hypothetical protein